MIIDESYMMKVIRKSRELIYQNESPFAAGILFEDVFIINGNQSRTKRNPILHAEIACINSFCEQFDCVSLQNATIYSSCEPCLMCFHAIFNAGIKRIVYGATIDDAIRFNSGDIPIHIKEYTKKMKLNIDISGEVLRKEAIDVFNECILYRGDL